MCGFCDVWVCACVGVCMCVFVYVWVCVCVGLCICGCVHVWVLTIVCVGVLAIYLLKFTEFFIVNLCIFIIIFTSVRTTSTE